jgi:Tfp pilus assembly protein PilN
MKGRDIIMSKSIQSTFEKNAATASNRPRRKSRRWLWITLGIVALLCIPGVLAVNFTVNPAIAEEQYYIAIRDQDYARAYSYLGSDVQARLSQQAFIQQAQQQDEALGKVTRYTEDNLPAGVTATITETVTRAHGATYKVHLELRQEGGAWKITSFDRI